MHISMKMYLCTIPNTACFGNLGRSPTIQSGISQTNSDNMKLITSEEFTLNSSTLLTIQNIFQDSQHADNHTSANSRNSPILINDGDIPVSNAEVKLQWTICGRITLTSKDKQLILNGSKLKDNHINAFHNVAKMQFPLIGGLHNTLILNKTLLNVRDFAQSLQILFIPDRSHWALLQVEGTVVMFVYMIRYLHLPAKIL